MGLLNQFQIENSYTVWGINIDHVLKIVGQFTVNDVHFIISDEPFVAVEKERLKYPNYYYVHLVKFPKALLLRIY